jgi:hypothetical protein
MEDAAQLHDRATKGEPLTAEQETRLEAWYAEQDAFLEGLQWPAGEPDLAALRAGVEAATARLVAESRRVQQLSAENDELRQEIAALRRKLARFLVQEPA